MLQDTSYGGLRGAQADPRLLHAQRRAVPCVWMALTGHRGDALGMPPRSSSSKTRPPDQAGRGGAKAEDSRLLWTQSPAIAASSDRTLRDLPALPRPRWLGAQTMSVRCPSDLSPPRQRVLRKGFRRQSGS